MTVLSMTWDSVRSSGVLWMASGALAAGAWAFHVWRLRRRERALLGIVEERTREWARERAARAYAACEAGEAAGGAASVEDGRILVLAGAGLREDLVGRLAGLGFDLAFADGVWAVRAACRDAFDTGRPYNLVLLDATHSEIQEGDGPARLQAELDRFGVRVGMMRPCEGRREAGRRRAASKRFTRRAPDAAADEGCLQQGIGADENPDRGGRSGFTPAAAADAAALGLRSRRRE